MCSSLGLPHLGLYFLDLADYFLSHIREVFIFYLFKYFLRSFLSPPPGTCVMQMLVRLMLSQRSLKAVSFLFILFSIFCSAAVISNILPCRSFIYSCCCSLAQLCLTLCDSMDCSMPGFSVLHHPQSLFKLLSIGQVMPFNHLILSHPLLLLLFPSMRVFSSQSALHIRWPKYWSFSSNPSVEYSGLISFRIDWFDLLAIQGTLKSLLQQHSLKAQILRCSVFFYGTTLASIHDYWKNHSFDCMDICRQSNVSGF